MQGDSTNKNLYTAYVGEAKASVRLKIYAEEADREGFPGIARLFRAVAESESVHARNNLRMLGEIEDTETNLAESLSREEKIAGVGYASFIGTAESEGNDAAARMFTWARDVESVHAKLYGNALEHMMADKDPVYHICGICGYVADGSVPDKCPVCGAASKVFYEAP